MGVANDPYLRCDRRMPFAARRLAVIAGFAGLAAGVEKLYKLRVLTRASAGEQNEILRKMVLGMVEDIRVVLLRLASRTQTLRFLARGVAGEDRRRAVARETLALYAPLANRLGIWQMKGELEDLGFRYVNPETYREIAANLDSRRIQREGEMQEIKNQLRKTAFLVGYQIWPNRCVRLRLLAGILRYH